MLMLMKILSNALDIYMYFPEEEVREPRSKKEDTVETEKKAKPPFIHSKKIEKIEKKEKREKTNSWFHTTPTSQYLPVPPKVSCLCLLSWLWDMTYLSPTDIPTDPDRYSAFG